MVIVQFEEKKFYDLIFQLQIDTWWGPVSLNKQWSAREISVTAGINVNIYKASPRFAHSQYGEN